MQYNHEIWVYDSMTTYLAKGPVGLTGIAGFYIAMAILMLLGAIDQYNRMSRFVGNRELTKIKWERGLETSSVGEFTSYRLPPTRFLCCISCLLMLWDFTTRICQNFDMANSYYVGFHWQWSMNITYALECGILLYAYAETLGMEGPMFYAGAAIASLVLGVFTEFMRGGAHWVCFVWSVFALYCPYVPLWQRTRELLDILGAHKCTVLAHWYVKMTAAIIFGGWWLFIIPWILRNDMDLSHGWVHRDYIDIFHGGLVVLTKPLYGYLLNQYVLIQEEIHMDEILRVMHWDVDTSNEPLMTDVPNEVVVVTTPAILNYAVKHYKDPESTARAKKELRNENKTHIELSPAVLKAIENGTFEPSLLRKLSSKNSNLSRQHSGLKDGGFKAAVANKMSVVDGDITFGVNNKKVPDFVKADASNLFGILPPKVSNNNRDKTPPPEGVRSPIAADLAAQNERVLASLNQIAIQLAEKK